MHIKPFWDITKPRVTLLAVFCAVIGLLLSSDSFVGWDLLLYSAFGIWLLAASGFAINCLAERTVDAKMSRTKWRPTVSGELKNWHVLLFSIVLSLLGFGLLFFMVNPLTAWLTLATFFGYAIVYTLWLKPATHQNIVIGGLFGAMPPLLGWTSFTNHIDPEAWLLVLIIFLWTPPHFWSLALYRRDEYAKSGLPMLPVTHGAHLTSFHCFLYAILLTISTILPYLVGMSSWLYLVIALVLGGHFIWKTWRLYRNYTDAQARSIFIYSLTYLSLLFAALLLDHYTFPQLRRSTILWVEMPN